MPLPDSASGTLRAADGAALPLDAAFRHRLYLAALRGGHPLTLMGEWNGQAFLPLSGWHEGRLYNFDTDLPA